MYGREEGAGKDVVKVLENGLSVADHAESHVQWILLVGGNNFFRTDVRFRRPFLAGEPKGATMNYSTRNSPHSGRLSGRSWKKGEKKIFSRVVMLRRFGGNKFVNIALNVLSTIEETFLRSNIFDIKNSKIFLNVS